MKLFYSGLMILIISLYISNAQSDTLVLITNNNQVIKIPVAQISKITFDLINKINETMPEKPGLNIKGNFPNPFQLQTTIEFEIEEPGTVEIMIFDNTGNQIQTLLCKDCKAGKNSLVWNCLDKNNQLVPSGIYFYEVSFNKYVQSKKMILIK